MDDRERWRASMAPIALEGRCFVLSANQFLTRAAPSGDVHPVQGEDPQTVLLDGGSTIVPPLGVVLAGPLRGNEEVLVAEVDLDEVDLDEVTRAKFDLGTAGHYARPDVFTLSVDETPRASVHAVSAGTRKLAEQPVRARVDERPLRTRRAHPPTDHDDLVRGRA